MSDEYAVYWSQSAKDDLDEIIEYISKDSPQNALKILESLEKQTNDLVQFPKRGRIIPELKKHNIYKYREIIHAPWRIFFKIEEKKVYVFAVIDGRRNIDDLLLRRQLR